MATILMVDDDLPIREMLRMHLDLAGHDSLSAENAAEARALLAKSTVDVALLDVMMPGEDGFSLSKVFVDQGIPVLFLTAKTAVTDRVRGLRLGAEDYILKPFEPAELLARIDVILRRTGKQKHVYQDARLLVDYDAHTVCCHGLEVCLTALEYDLLTLLTQREGRAMHRNELLSSVWGYDYVGETRTLDVHVQRLRKKLGMDSIETVYKYGYRYTRKENT